MPKVSRETASETIALEGLEVKLEHLDGGYSVCFESHTADADLADLFRGLPDDRCQLPRWGYVIKGRVAFRIADREETYEAGDAYYVPPGHTPIHYAGAEIVEFSPTDVLAQTIPVVMDNLHAAGVAVRSQSSDTVIVRPDPSPAQAPSVEVVRGVYDALARRDIAAVLGAMADDIEWCEAEGMPYGGVYHGGAAVAENVLGPITQDIPNFAVTAEDVIASGDTVAVVARYTGTGKTTGKRLDLSVLHLWDVRDDKLARFRQFADTAEFLEVVPLATATRPVAHDIIQEGRA